MGKQPGQQEHAAS
jgi:hypothetical protein